jgi:thioredoxin 1
MKIIKTYIMKDTLSKMVLVIMLAVTACGRNNSQKETDKTQTQLETESKDSEKKYKVTFIELGSVRCIPCRQMQFVMKSVEAKYGKDVKVEFYDVWTDAGKPYGVKYGIEAIPTQVFLDESGKEYYRHEGFFPEGELFKVLQQKGVKTN